VAGNQNHGDLIEFFPLAQAAECNGDGKWATVTYSGDGYGSHGEMAPCPRCERDRLVGAVRSFVPPRFRAPIEIPAAVAAWAERGRSAQGLYLAGQVGTGKTHAAWAAVVAWCCATRVRPAPGPGVDWGIRATPPVIFTRMTDLLDDLRPGDDSRQRIRDCQQTALLVIDDVGAEKPSEWTQERFYSVIDDRYANCRPLIVTSNLPPKKLGPQVGERSASRLAEMCGDVVPMTGSDRRKTSE
jgi:DNA replication protein DnaC